MAFEILEPDVGTRMLRTFGAISEDNRKRQQIALDQERAMQNIMLKDAALTIRDQGQQLNAVKTANNYELALARLAIAQGDAERKAAVSGLEMLKKQFDLDADRADLDAATEAAAILSEPDEKGLTLHQRLLSGDPKQTTDAMRQFVGAAGRLQGKGKRTAGLFDSVRRNFNDTLKTIEGQQSAELAARREERLAESAEGAAARAERSLTNQEKRTGIMQSEADRKKAAAFGGGASKGQGEYFPGGSAKMKVPGFGVMSLDQVRETLAAGGQVSEKLKGQLKNVEGGKTADGEPLGSPWDDAAISELEQQGKQIQQQKKGGGASTAPLKTPSGVAIDPANTDPLQVAPDPSGLDAIFQRGTTPARGDVAPLPPLPDPGNAGLEDIGAIAPAPESFFGLPRRVRMP